MDKATVIIPTFNRADVLAVTLESLVAQDGLGEVIVADDGSSDHTAVVVAQFAKTHPVRYYYQPDEGFRAGAARNLGIENASHDVLIFLDDDCVPQVGLVRAHLDFHRRRPRSIGLGLRTREVFSPSTQGILKLIPDPRAAEFPNGVSQAPFYWRQLHSCHFSYRYLDYPLQFDTTFKGWGMEDCELGYRFWELGAAFEFVPGALVIHRDEASPRDPFLRKILGQPADYGSYLKNCVRFLDRHPFSQEVRNFVFDQLRWHNEGSNEPCVKGDDPQDVRPLLQHLRAQLEAAPVGPSAPHRPPCARGEKPALLYIAPVAPSHRGKGTEQRAAAILEALAKQFEVHLVIIPIFGMRAEVAAAPFAAAQRTMVLRLEGCLDTYYAMMEARIEDHEALRHAALTYPLPFHARYSTAAANARIASWSGGVPYAAVHIQRLYMAPLTHPFRRLPVGQRPFFVLDLDDDEAEAHRRLAEAARGDALAGILAREASKYVEFGREHLKLFDQVAVCSDLDADRLRRAYQDVAFSVLDNIYASSDPVMEKIPSEALRLLFVGSLSYPPNADAVLILCERIVPKIRNFWRGEIVIDVVGPDPSMLDPAVARTQGVSVHGWVDDVAPFYANTDVAVVPLQAGGGTRIKILEAFTHGTPVVSTSLGAEGLGVVDGLNVLIADDDEAFARACWHIKQDPALSARLAKAGLSLVQTAHSPEAMEERVRAIYAPVFDRISQGARSAVTEARVDSERAAPLGLTP